MERIDPAVGTRGAISIRDRWAGALGTAAKSSRAIRVVALTALLAALPAAIWKDTRDHTAFELEREARYFDAAIAAIRSYYASEVVSRVFAVDGKDVRVVHDYPDTPGGIPTPAALSIALGDMIVARQAQMTYRFGSDFPYRRSGAKPLDEFETRGLAELRRAPDLPVIEARASASVATVRYMSAVTMLPACVACHNTHPDSPKRDWKVGDVRGFQEFIVERPIVLELSSFRWMTTYMLAAIAAGAISLMIVTAGQRRTEEMNVALAQARKAAEEAANAKAAFLAVISHEIRTPMNGVVTMADILDETPLDEDQRNIVRVIRTSGQALSTIVNDVLDFSKIEAGRFEIEAFPFDLAAAIEDVAELISFRADEKNLPLRVSIDPAIRGNFVGDPGRVRQILLNLLSNAVKFTDRGAVDLAVAADSMAAAGRTATIRFEVRDTGIGISPENVSKLFKWFQQADASTSRRFGGTGLGLTISKQLVEMMGGRIGVHSTPGEGSTFWFEIPFPRADGEALAVGVDLTGVQVFPVGLSDREREIAAAYLGAAGAAVRDGAGLDEVEARGIRVRKEGGVCLVLIRDSLDTLQTLDRLRMSGADLSRVVVAVPRALLSTIGHARRSGVGSFLPLPMPRDQLLLAVAGAAGRVDASRSGDVRSNPDAQWIAPSVELAMANAALVQVVEDNPTNQEIIARILKRLGYAFRIASNGREALDQLALGGAAIVLTDYHMPLMDGFALARAIREKEAGTGERLPIVALTADAMSRTERHCLDAGMDGFLTKPVNVPALRAVLEKWNPRGKELRGRPDGDAALAALPPLRRPAPPPSEDVDMQRIEDVFGGLDTECLEMLRSFHATLPARIASIESALTGGEAAQARDLCHATKGAAASIGAKRVAEAFAQVQAAIDAGTPDAAAAELSKLADAAAGFGRALTGLRPGTSVGVR